MVQTKDWMLCKHVYQPEWGSVNWLLVDSYGWEIPISGWPFQGHSEKKLTTKTMSVEKLWLKQCRPRLILILLLIKGVYNDWK